MVLTAENYYSQEANAEEKEMKEICKRYAILGKTEEELLPVLKSTKNCVEEMSS